MLNSIQKQSIDLGRTILLFPVKDLFIECPVCHTGKINNNLICDNTYCKERHTVPFVRRGFLKNIDGRPIKSIELRRNNDLSVYTLENLGIIGASGRCHPAELQLVFSNFKDWYIEQFDIYRDSHFSFIVEI